MIKSDQEFLIGLLIGLILGLIIAWIGFTYSLESAFKGLEGMFPHANITFNVNESKLVSEAFKMINRTG